MVDLEIFKLAVMESQDGISIADARRPDMSLVFVNPAFERMTGYAAEEVIGQNCLFLQAEDADEATCTRLRDAIANGQNCSVTLASYRRDGSHFWNELSLSPIHDERGELTHFIGIHKDVTDRVLVEERMQAQYESLDKAKRRLEKRVAMDALTGIYNRQHFDSRLDVMWKIASRSTDSLALFFIDIDHFKDYNDSLGHPAGDQALVSVARALSDSFQRGSDFLARYGGEEFVVLAGGMKPATAARFATRLCERVRGLQIPHPATPGGRLTISVGYDVIVPQPSMRAPFLLECADRALFFAKAQGRDCAMGFRDTGLAAASAVSKPVCGLN